MAASGNEVVKLNQLKEYVKFASDEDAAAYFEPQEEFAVDFSSGDMSDWTFDGDVVIDENTINLTGKLNGAKYISYPDIVDVGTIPKQYAPTTNQSFQIARLNASGYETGYYTLNIYTDSRLEIVAPNAGGGWCYGFQFVDTSWTFTPVSANITGEEVLTAAQLKKLIESGSGGGTGGGWLTIMSGNWNNASNKLLALTEVDNIDLDNYSKIAIECKSTIYGTQSGRFEFNLPLPSVSDYHAAGNNEFELSGMGWSVGAIDYNAYWVLCVRCVDNYFDSFMTITKVEVM